MIYFTSDLHLGHENICSMSARPFSNIDEMNETLISNINDRVAPDDELYVLGDVSYRIGIDEAAKLMNRINCENLYLVKGNHDKHWQLKRTFKEIVDYKEIKIDGFLVVLMHYPISSWNGMHRGSVHLHGHSHNTFDYNVWNVMNERSIWDVGVDANGYLPISWEEIYQELGLGIEHDEAWHAAKRRAWEEVRVPGSDYPTPSHHEMYGLRGV